MEEAIAVLRRYDTCAVANALDALQMRPKALGYTNGDIHALFPELGIMAGYAVTARVSARASDGHAPYVARGWYEAVLAIPEPRIVVLQDVDAQPAGAFWGEVQANIHSALGCIGTVGTAAARDLPEMRELRFQVFTPRILLGRGHMHMIDFGGPVSISGVTVHTGDLVQADLHGAHVVPKIALAELDERCRQLMSQERNVIAFCQSRDFSVDGLRALGR